MQIYLTFINSLKLLYHAFAIIKKLNKKINEVMEIEKNKDQPFFIAFNHLLNFTFERYKLLMKKFPDLETAFYGSFSDLLEAGWKKELASDFIIKGLIPKNSW